MSEASAAPRAPYRPDIDGLRAISVAAVVMYHAEMPGVAGGFVGVDVFFVISGYLITQWLMTRGASGPRALLGEFYLRRARRILPALLLMLCVATLVVWWLFQPPDLTRYGKYLLGAVLMAGNFAAWSDGDYFATAVGFAPLTHLWSIAVEEQFYLLFPLLLLAMRRLTVGWQAGVLTLLAVGSFAVCVVASFQHPVANFYLGPTRAWELLLGSVLAYGVLDAAARRFAAGLAGLGLLAIIAPMVLFNRELHYPGLATLVPAFGTAAFIVAGRVRQTAVGRLFALPPCVTVGRASYSIYLWHLPPLVFATYYLVDRPAGGLRAALVVVSLCVAFIAWYAFEEPLRRRRWLVSDRRFVIALAAAFSVLAIVGAVWWRSEGFPQRFSQAEQRILASAALHPDANKCMNLDFGQIAAGQLCQYGPDLPTTRRVLLWGDSHALAILPGYESLAHRLNLRIYFAGTTGCRPMPGYLDTSLPPAPQRRCLAYNNAMLQAARKLRPDVVILAASWVYPALTVTPVGESREVPMLDALENTARDLKGSAPHICVVHDVPILRHPVPYALIGMRRRGLDTTSLTFPDPTWVEPQREVDAVLSALARESGVTEVDPRPVLCPGDSCRVEVDGEVLYRDTDHLSVKGAIYVAEPLAGCFANLR